MNRAEFHDKLIQIRFKEAYCIWDFRDGQNAFFLLSLPGMKAFQ